jgi:hypothetical protein
MRSWLVLGAGWAVLAAYGCTSGSRATASTGPSTGGSSTVTGTTTSTSTGGATTTGTSTGASTTTGPTGTTSSGITTVTTTTDTTSTTPPPPCPIINGLFKMTAQGQGCGDLDLTAPQCIKETMNFCTILFVSKPGTTGDGINGLAMVDMAGNFTGASLKEGSAMRTGCTGTYTTGFPTTMVVDCGGMGTSQSCVVTLTRTGLICPF